MKKTPRDQITDLWFSVCNRKFMNAETRKKRTVRSQLIKAIVVIIVLVVLSLIFL